MKFTKIHTTIALAAMLGRGQIYAQNQSRQDSISKFLAKLDNQTKLIKKDDLAKNGLKFIKYEINNSLTPEKVLLDTISKSTCMVIPIDINNNSFYIGQYTDLLTISKLNKRRTEIFNYYKGGNNIVVDLYWNYKNKYYITHAVFNMDKVDLVFDNFASQTLYYKINPKSKKEIF